MRKIIKRPITNLHKLSLSFIITVFSIVIAYRWLDRPIIEYAVLHNWRQFNVLRMFTAIPELEIFILLCASLYILLQHSCREKITVIAANDSKFKMLLIALSVCFLYVAKNVIKVIFGRNWPVHWQQYDMTWVPDHVYGFNLFSTDVTARAFPSGHTAVTAAVATGVYYLFPRWFWLALVGVLLVIIGLIGMSYHFLSDIICGVYLGILLTSLVLGFFRKVVYDK